MRRDSPGPYSLDALKALPVPSFFAADQEALKARYVAWFEQISGRKLYPMQVEMLLIETLAYAMAMLGEEGQATAEQHLVAFADARGLARLAANRSCPRLPASRARVTVRFALEATRAVPTGIAAGTWLVAGDLIFATIEAVVIMAGALSVDVVAEALETGAAGNALQPGQISQMVSPLEGVSVANIDVSAGGADIEEVEAWRLRIANAYDALSPGGGVGWYREMAMGVSPAIIDVAVVRPQPCYVDIYPLTAEGAAPQLLLDAVTAALNTERALDTRFGDAVTVRAAEAVTADLTLTLRLGATAGPLDVTLATARAEAVLADWRGRLGALVVPNDVEAAARAGAGVVDAELSGIAFAQLQPQQFLAATLAVAVVYADG